MAKYAYPIKLGANDKRCWLNFPDLSLSLSVRKCEARWLFDRAAEALRTEIEVYYILGLDLPEPSTTTGRVVEVEF